MYLGDILFNHITVVLTAWNDSKRGNRVAFVATRDPSTP
jgi:hypothetical protein